MDALKNKMKISSVVAALCILVYIAAIAFGAVRIIAGSGERRDLAEKEFYDLADRASSSAVFLGFMSEAYQETLKEFIGASNVLLGIIITGSGGEYAFEREPGSGIVWAGDSPRFKTGAGIPEEPFYMPLRIEGQRNVTIQAVYNIIDYGLCQRVLKNVLFAVVIALLIAFVTLIAEMRQRKKAGPFRADAAGEPAAFEREPEPVWDDEREEPDSGGPDDSKQNPRGLYTARGNIGWESYTRDRLSSELHRCSSFEQDLTFITMEFSRPSPFYRQFADEAVGFFSMRDLIFEKGENGISVIIPSADLEQGIAKSEEFRERIGARLPDASEGNTELCIGLSSRSGRLVDADRLMLEASRALEKALGDKTSRIIAFKSDPEKYREFIRQNSRNT